MAQQLTVAPAGLFTDPNPLSAAPDGAMTEALNVVIARPGVIEPRPGLQSVGTDLGTYPDGFIIQTLQFNDGVAMVAAYDRANSRFTAYYNGSEVTQAGPFNGDSAYAAQSDDNAPRFVIYDQNVYLLTTDGVFRFEAGSSSMYRAGLPRPGNPLVAYSTSGTNNPMTADTAVAWRYCYTFESGGVVFRGPPSARTIQRSYTGSSDKRNGLTQLQTYLTTYDQEIYRSEFTAAYTDTPSDEMTLIGTLPVSTAGTFYDDVDSTGLKGPSLYTNATEDGALLENGITPFCNDIALFRDMMFFANAKYAPSLTFEVLGVGADWRGSNASTGDRLTSFTITGDTTITSTTVSNVSASDIAKVRVGQVVCLSATSPGSADASFAAATYVTAVAGTSFTISAAALASGVAATLRLTDWIEVTVVDSGTTTVRAYATDEFSASTTVNVQGAQKMAYTLSAARQSVSAIGDGVTDAWTFVVETWESDITSLTVKVSNKEAVSSRIDYSTGKTVLSTDAPDGVLRWSKPGQLEACPPPYSKRICPSALQRLIVSRDSLFVFSELDGVYLVSGYSPDTLQVDEYDRTMRLVHPNAVCDAGGRVAAWTNKGVVLMDSSGKREIGQPIANVLDAAASTLASATTGYGIFLHWWPERQMLFLGVPASASTGYSQYVYVWHERTGAWTRWESGDKLSCAASYKDTLYFGVASLASGDDTLILKTVDESYDYTYSITVTSVDSAGTGITISAAGLLWTPTVGDIVRQSNVDYAVTAVSGATTFTVHTSGLAAAAATAYSREDSQIKWTVRHGGNPGAQKNFRKADLLFGSAAGITDITSSIVTDRSRTAATATATLSYTSSDVPETVPIRVTREAKKCGRLEHTITIPAAKPGWQLHGASYVYEPIDTRFRDAS